jgi:hypothetical protein
MSIDYDLQACLEYNPQDEFDVYDIKEVLAVWEGENDGDDWRWVLQLKDDRFVFLQGGCDFTGWDCQSWAISQFEETANQAAMCGLGDIELKDSQPGPYDAGLGHMINILSGEYMSNANSVYQSLLMQLNHGKDKTWREKMDKEFDIKHEDESE